MTKRYTVEDALKQFHRAEYEGWLVTADSLAGSAVKGLIEAANLLARLQADGFVEPSRRGFRLTETGRRYALHVVRAHRLFETWLARETGTAATDWHRKAEQAEHTLSEEEAEALSASLGHPRFDPHGDPIPTRHLTLPSMGEISLLEAEPDKVFQIVHIEDEPSSVFRTIAARGLAPGVVLRLIRLGKKDVSIEAESRVFDLSRVEAGQIQVIRALVQIMHPDWERLSDLDEGSTALVRGLSAVCQGPERLRLLDLGVVPGSRVNVELSGPFRSPRGYRIRGTLVGLRNDQADNIFVTREDAS